MRPQLISGTDQFAVEQISALGLEEETKGIELRQRVPTAMRIA